MTRIILKIAAYLLIFILVSSTLILFVLSEFGLQTSANIIERFVPELKITTISGSLLSHFTVNGLAFHNKDVDLTANHVEIAWQPLALFSNEVRIEQLRADHLELALHIQKSKEKSALPIDIIVEQGTIQNAKVYVDNTKINNASLKALPLFSKQIPLIINKTQFALQLKTDSTEINLPLCQGSLADKQFNAQFAFNTVKNNFAIKNLLLTVGTAKVQLDGELNNQWHVTWNMNIPNLAEILPKNSGNFISQGTITGPRVTPNIVAELQGNNLLLQAITDSDNHANDQSEVVRAGKINGKVQLNLQPEGIFNIALTSSRINYNDNNLADLTISAIGTTQKHNIIISAQNAKQAINLNLTGGIFANEWRGSLDNFTYNSGLLGTWQLAKKTNLVLGKEAIKINNACMSNGTRQLCAQVLWQKDLNISAKVRGENIALQDILHLTNTDKQAIAANGFINFQTDLKIFQNQDINLHGVVNLTPGNITFTQNDQTQNISFSAAKLNINIDKKGLFADTALTIQNQQKLSATLQLPKFHNLNADLKNQPINARLTLINDQLFWLDDLIPQIKNTRGNINLNMLVTGTLKKPILQGRIQLANGYTEIPELGINLTNINIVGTGDPRSTINWQASAIAGSNPLQLTGSSLLNQTGKPTKLVLTGKQITLMNTKQYQLFASPNVTLTYVENALNITGLVNIDKAVIQEGNFNGGSVSLPDDVVFIEPNKKPEPALPFKFTAQLQINLGNNASIQTNGASGQLVGSLLLDYDSTKTSKASGEINLTNGKYDAYGQQLNITTGKITFTGGPIDNPIINIQATRMVTTSSMQSNASLDSGFLSPVNFAQPGQVLVGIDVSGTAKNYKVTLFSQPAVYNQSDILSLLMLGTTSDQLSSAGGQILMSAASQLNLGGGQITNITQQLQNALGLDQLDIGQESVYDPNSKSILQTTSLTVGKKIGERLSLNYSIGIFDPISIVTLRYQISNSWSVQTNASTLGQGADIFYTVEKE